MIRRWWRRTQGRKECFHHDRPAWSKGEVDSRSFIREELIDLGRRKLYVCEEAVGGCGRMWFIP